MEANIRKIVDVNVEGLPPFKVAEWNHPDEVSRNWNHTIEKVVFKEHWANYIKEGDITIDLGAYSGDSTVMMAVLSKNTIAFEPNPESFAVLKATADLNPWMNIKAEQAAITVNGGSARLYDRTQKYCNPSTLPQEGNYIEVKAYTLMGYLEENNIPLDKISFIKIDCEGIDIDILKTFKDGFRPVIYIEWFVELGDKIFIDTVESMGYEILDPLTNKPITHRIANVLCVPRK